MRNKRPGKAREQINNEEVEVMKAQVSSFSLHLFLAVFKCNIEEVLLMGF